MKYYLIAILLVIMGAGARTMFEIAYQGMALEHGATPNRQTWFYIFLVLWFVLMMVADILILTNKSLKFRNTLAALLAPGVLGPVIYMLINSK